MEIYYHFTLRKNVASILSEGIRPASETGNKNQYDDFSVNHNYSYLYSSEAINSVILEPIIMGISDLFDQGYVLLRAEIDDSVLERDYDQLSRLIYDKEKVIRKSEIFGPEMDELRNRAQWLGVNNLNELTMENLKQTADSIPDAIWRHWPGAYRTKNAISVVKFLNLDKEALANAVCRSLLLLTGRTPSLAIPSFLTYSV